MASNFSQNVEAQIVGTIIGGAILLAPAAIFAGAAPFLTAALGERATYLAELLLGAATLLFTVVAAHYYFFVLPGGREPAGSLERRHYDDLREDLAKGGTAARIYSEKLTTALKAVEHFFRDSEAQGQRAFGMKSAAPLWTAEAFHGCLLIALAYPIVVIFLIWTISGDVGPVEDALGLPANLPTWQRVAFFAGDTVSALAYWRSQRTRGGTAVAWFAFAAVVAIAGAIGIAASIADIAGAITITGAVIGAVAGDIGVAIFGAAVGAVAGALTLAVANTVVATVAGFTTVAFVAIAAKAAKISIARGRHAIFWWLSLPLMIVVCFVGAQSLSRLSSWPAMGPLLLFVGLLTLLNAPFVWFSLGLTRALLRRGLERQMWWPYFYALADAACAVVVIALLACTLVIGVQAFDLMAVRGGGSEVLPLSGLFNGIVANGFAPKYWWLYGLFFSTMIPSLANLTIGGMCLTRGIPRLSAYLKRVLESEGALSEAHRVKIAVLLGGQVVLGVALGILAQASLLLVMLRYAMPFLGVGILEMARAVAAYDLPGRIFGLL